MSNKLSLPPSFFSQIDIDEMPHIARVISEEKSVYILLTSDLREELISKNQKLILSVGDWVILGHDHDQNNLRVQRVLTPTNTLTRNKNLNVQYIATNIDKLLIVTSANSEFNLNRLDRYIQLALNTNLTPIIVITKTDLISKEEELKIFESINNRLPNIDVIGISVQSNTGLEKLNEYLLPNETIALMGSSGVGKSTLINYLKGSYVQKTQHIGDLDKGRHTTSNRKMFLLKNGSYIIDNPGIRSAPILILDEATSALDSASEGEVQAGLESLMEGRTVIVVAHRLSTIQKADRIIVLKKGKIVEVGSHQDLLNKKGEYFKFYSLQ